MCCPKIDELPSPPTGKIGWPWSEDSPQLQDRMPDDSPWPFISIVTPSFNQGKFLERAIRSVLLQGYQNLEYIVIDAGSTDNTLEIINKYEKWITYWVSEPDQVFSCFRIEMYFS
ncbi:MAG: glycosyltransferase [Proteobacteria bacterium]|nr:glycosyltransferase [Pseudomonadota bacterium]